MELKKLLSQDFRSHRLFKQAITHRSYSKDHNERLEFLGDAVLQLVMSEYLYNSFADKHEGQLTLMRVYLVRKETLTEVAENIHLSKWLKLGRGEKVDEISKAILADAMEAIIGALYLYQGLQPTWQFIQQIYTEHLEKLSDSDNLSDAKTQLQEYMQARGHPLPEYQAKQLMEDRGFEVVCEVVLGKAKGEGMTKREAEQKAARAMLRELEREQ